MSGKAICPARVSIAEAISAPSPLISLLPPGQRAAPGVEAEGLRAITSGEASQTWASSVTIDDVDIEVRSPPVTSCRRLLAVHLPDGKSGRGVHWLRASLRLWAPMSLVMGVIEEAVLLRLGSSTTTAKSNRRATVRFSLANQQHGS